MTTSLWMVAGSSAAATTAAAPIAYVVLKNRGVLDVPNHRSSHEHPTIRGGGLAAVGGILSTVVLFSATGWSMPWASLAACAIMAAIGFLDDVSATPAVARLGSQLLVGAALGAVLGGPVMALLGLVALPVAVNAVNFMDGINGITGFAVASWAVVVLWAVDTAGATVLAALALGASLALLPWNCPRAWMFVGDSGSYLFGALIATSFLETAATGAAWEWTAILAPLSPYFLDTGLTLWRRWRSGMRLFEAHRQHIYQQLVSHRWSHVRVSAGVGAACLLSGVSATLLPPPIAILSISSILLAYALSPRILRRI